MTPQERELITELFDRLASLEGSPRDGEADRAIAEGLARAPHAIYPLVQTVLVQDEALKRANARIQELEGADGGAGTREGGSFLDSMRGALFGRDSSARGSVPSVPPGSTSGQYAPPPPQAPGYAPSPGYAPAPGGSFLGTAAASAAGVIGGSLLLDSIRSMFSPGHAFAGAREPTAPAHSPWDDRGAGNSDLAREAGADDVNASSHDHQHSAGSFDTADSDNDNDYDDDGDGDGDFDGGDFDGEDVA